MAADDVVGDLNLDGSRPRMHVRSENGILLSARKTGDPLLNLEFQYWCADSTSSDYLSVQQSEVSVFPSGQSAPLFRLDAKADSHSVPATHWNIYAKRDHLVAVMRKSGRYSGSKHTKSLLKRPSGGLGKIHFPVGGWRFRPCLEDVMQMLIDEFDVACEAGAREVIREKRRRWREFQLAAAVWDHPEHAAASLREIGYMVTAPSEVRAERVDNTGAI